MNKAESSRINGAKSHGPVTPEGKQRSSANSVRHGLLTKSVCLCNESHDYFQHKLLPDFIARFQPADNVELRLVEQLASCSLRLERWLSVDAALFDHEMDERAKETKTYTKIDHATEFALGFKSLADNSKAIPLFLRYMTAISNQYDRTIKQLVTLRTKFPVPAAIESEVESPVSSEAPSGEPRPASAKPPEIRNEPTEPLTPCDLNTAGICSRGPDCPNAHLHQKIA